MLIFQVVVVVVVIVKHLKTKQRKYLNKNIEKKKFNFITKKNRNDLFFAIFH